MKTAEIAGDTRAREVVFEGGDRLPAGFVIIATGIRSNLVLPRLIGLETKIGVVVDDRMRTSHFDIFAAGDIAEHAGTVYGLWGPAQAQGRVAGANAAGSDARFSPTPRSNTLKVLGIGMFSVGEVEALQPGTVEIESEVDAQYLRFLFRDGRLKGAILLGNVKPASAVTRTLEAGTDLSALLARKPSATDVLGAIASA